MKGPELNRRKFITGAATAAAGMALLSGLPADALAAYENGATQIKFIEDEKTIIKPAETRIRFGVIGINHSHINSMVDAVTRGGGEFVSFYCKEPDLAAAFSKRYPKAKLAASEAAVLEDPSISL